MENWRRFAWVVVATVAGIVGAQSHETAGRSSDKEQLAGAWRLVRISAADTAGTPNETPPPVGMLIYTREGQMSVQLMYPKAAGPLSNAYVKDGYEASFGTYEVDEAAHQITHHVLGSNTGDLLVGRDLPRVYSFPAKGRLLIRPVSRDEHWSVIWERY
jgi:hypothetical protein